MAKKVESTEVEANKITAVTAKEETTKIDAKIPAGPLAENGAAIKHTKNW